MQAEAQTELLFDLEAAEKELGLTRDQALRFARRFVESNLNAAMSLLKIKEYQAFHDEAHRIKGAAANLRLNALWKAAKRVQHLADTLGLGNAELGRAIQVLNKTIIQTRERVNELS